MWWEHDGHSWVQQLGVLEIYLHFCCPWRVASNVQEHNSLPGQLSLRKTFSGWDMLLSITDYWQRIALQKVFTKRMIHGVHAIFETMLNWGWLWTDSSGITLFLMTLGEMEWGELLSIPLILNLGNVPISVDIYPLKLTYWFMSISRPMVSILTYIIKSPNCLASVLLFV